MTLAEYVEARARVPWGPWGPLVQPNVYLIQPATRSSAAGAPTRPGPRLVPPDSPEEFRQQLAVRDARSRRFPPPRRVTAERPSALPATCACGGWLTPTGVSGQYRECRSCGALVATSTARAL